MKQVRQVSCAETAELVGKALKKAFPDVKFSIRSHRYEGGASMNVGWVDDGDGPSQREVDGLLEPYARGDPQTSWLEPDGAVTIARDHDADAPVGPDAPSVGAPISDDAELVRFGCDFIFVNRRLGESFRKGLQDTIEELTDKPYANGGIYRFSWRGKEFDGWGGHLVHQMSQIDRPELDADG